MLEFLFKVRQSISFCEFEVTAASNIGSVSLAAVLFWTLVILSCFLPKFTYIVPNQTPLEHHFIVNVFWNPGIEWRTKLRCPQVSDTKGSLLSHQASWDSKFDNFHLCRSRDCVRLQYFKRLRCSVQTFLCLLCTARNSGNVLLKSWRFRMRNVRPRYRNSGAFVHGTKFRNFSPIMEQGQSRVRRLYDFRTIEFHVTPRHSPYTVLWCLKLRYKYLWISTFFNHIIFIFSLEYFFQSYAKGLKAAKSEIYMVGDVRPDGPG